MEHNVLSSSSSVHFFLSFSISLRSPSTLIMPNVRYVLVLCSYLHTLWVIQMITVKIILWQISLKTFALFFFVLVCFSVPCPRRVSQLCASPFCFSPSVIAKQNSHLNRKSCTFTIIRIRQCAYSSPTNFLWKRCVCVAVVYSTKWEKLQSSIVPISMWNFLFLRLLFVQIWNANQSIVCQWKRNNTHTWENVETRLFV